MLEGFPPGLEDHFEPRGVLGKGAMGTVFLAIRRSDGGEVAIKVVRERGSATLRDRFLREAKSQARIEHPQVLRIFDWGEDEGDPYLVMEVLEGRSLERGPVDYDPLAVMMQIAEGLEAVHAAGLVHRDLKPANVFLCRDGRAVLTDFGLVRDPDLTALTRTGQVVGSLGYLPPEVLLGERPGAPSDWYAWGVCLFRLREGRLPFEAEQLVVVAQGGPRPDPVFEVLDLESPEAEVIRRQLSVDPAARLAGCAAIRACLRGRPPRGASPTRSQAFHAEPSGFTWGRALALGVIMLGLVVGLVGSRGGGEPVPTRPAPAPTSPLGMGFGLEVRAQLSAAGELMVDERGEVHELPDGPIPESWGPLVDADPHHYPLLVEHMPALRRWHDFLGQGGAPEALPLEQQEELREADERFRVVGYPGPFGPTLLGPGEARRQGEVGDPLFGAAARWPREQGPWMVRALDEYQAGVAERERLAEALPGLGARDLRFLDDQTRLQLEILGSANNPLSSTLRELGRIPASRPFVADWTRDGTEHLLGFLHAIGRSLREEPETSREAALIVHGGLSSLELFRHSVIAWMPRSALASAGGDELARAFVDLVLRRLQLSGRGPLSVGRAAEIEAILAASAVILGGALEDEGLASQAIADLAGGQIAGWAAREGARDRAWLDVLRPHLAKLAERPRLYRQTWRALVDLWFRNPDALRRDPELARVLRGALEVVREDLRGEHRRLLEECLEELGRATG